MTGCTVRRYEQLETSPGMIEQELRPAVCEHKHYSIHIYLFFCELVELFIDSFNYLLNDLYLVFVQSLN